MKKRGFFLSTKVFVAELVTYLLHLSGGQFISFY